MENGTYKQIVTHLKRELELNGLEAPEELLKNNVSQYATNTKADRLKPTCNYFKKLGHDENQSRLLKRQKEQSEDTQYKHRNKTSGANYSIQTRIQTRILTATITKTVTELKESRKLFIPPVRHVERQTTPQRKATMEPRQPINRLPAQKTVETESGSRKSQLN